MQGVLLVDKPAGWTSFDIVNYVRKIVAAYEGRKPKNTKVGHAGTLDPFATGLLILLIGKNYTRRAGEFSKLDKTYEVTMRLGATSTTGDPEGEISFGSDRHPSEAEVMAALERFKWEIEQIPPAYSAIKINGQRAYKLARAGQEVTLQPRKVTIYDIHLDNYRYPEVKFTARVSSGTYIRSLVEDIGHVLQVSAYTLALQRTQIAKFYIKDALAKDAINRGDLAAHLLTI